MEQDEITRRNVAIAEYMDTILKLNRETGLWEHCEGSDYEDACLEYHCSYEWLMPVVEKITKESNLGFHFFPPFGREVFTCRLGTNKNSEGKSMIEATWKAVSEYVLALKS